MLAIPLDLPPPPMPGTAVTIILEHAPEQPAETRSGINLRDYLYDPGNSLTVDTRGSNLAEEPAIGYQPRTELGRRLLALRRSYLEHGGRLLSADALDEDMRARRGDLTDA